MEILRTLVDLSIRRACGFASLAIGMVMLALSFDLPLALRTGAAMTSILCVALAVMAWRSPRQDVRRTEFWVLFASTHPEMLAAMDPARLRASAHRIWRERLVWHADRIGLASLVLWAVAGLATLLRVLGGD
jgi:hypothetical protein